MKIHVLRDHPAPEQISEMLEELRTYIKLEVDVRREIVAGGGEERIIRSIFEGAKG